LCCCFRDMCVCPRHCIGIVRTRARWDSHWAGTQLKRVRVREHHHNTGRHFLHTEPPPCMLPHIHTGAHTQKGVVRRGPGWRLCLLFVSGVFALQVLVVVFSLFGACLSYVWKLFTGGRVATTLAFPLSQQNRTAHPRHTGLLTQTHSATGSTPQHS
jgi:hypothetical protein